MAPPLSAVFWNTNGLASAAKTSLHCTFQFLARHDIVALSETKLGSVPRHLLPEHTLHYLSAPSNHVSGRGLLLGVRTSLNLRVRPWRPACGLSGAIWLQISTASQSEQLFVGVCYVPPAGSPQLRDTSLERRLHALGREVSAANGIGTILLGGDFNAKVRRDMGSDRLAARFNLPLRTCGCGCGCGCGCTPRACSCRQNEHGRRLLSFCANHDLALCTGRVPGDETATPTWGISGRGTPSRLDHVLVSAGSFDRVLHCTVPRGAHLRKDSDHQPIALQWDLARATTHIPFSLTGEPLCTIAWDRRYQEAYACELQAPAAQAQLASCIAVATSGDLTTCDQLLSNVMSSAALTAGARRSSPGLSRACSNRPTHSAPFFDAECVAAHKRYWAARRTATAAGGFHLAEQQYKRLIRRKQRAWQLQQLRQHLCNLHRDPRMLWRSYNASRNALPESLRDPSCWNAFRDRLALRTPPADCHMPDGLDTPHISPAAVDCLNAAVITRGEVSQALAGLHNGRASGSSELAAEFLRYAVAPPPEGPEVPGDGLTSELGNLLAPALAALFTAAFASSEVPAAWKSSTVTPLYKKGDAMDVANYPHRLARGANAAPTATPPPLLARLPLRCADGWLARTSSRLRGLHSWRGRRGMRCCWPGQRGRSWRRPS